MSPPPTARRRVWLLLLIVVSAGVWLRLPDDRHRARRGVDEGYYEHYVTRLAELGISGWPKVSAEYIERQQAAPHAFLPPTRVLFLLSALLCHRAAEASPLEAVRWIAFGAGVATLLIGVGFAGRLGGLRAAVAVAALLGCAPLLIHLSHRALIDGFFALFALLAVWGLWEALRVPRHGVWLAVYGVAIAAMVLTKENAAFAFIAILAILALHRWLGCGKASPHLYVVTVAAPALAVVALAIAAGGASKLIEVYRLNIEKSVVLPYAIATGDGPWHRYLLDFVLMSPAVVVLALATIGATGWHDPAKRFLWLFIAISYAVMAQVRYGMNMRYGAMWEMPLCWLAFTQLAALGERCFMRHRDWFLAAAVAVACSLELRSYHQIFVASNVYDPVPGAMAQSLRMIKRPPPP